MNLLNAFSDIYNKFSTKPDKTSIKNIILQQQKFRMREDLASFETAIDDRDNIVNFNRELIHQIYRKALQDSHVASQWNTRKLKTIKKEFFVMPKGSEEPNEELTLLLESPWFFEFMNIVLDSKAWGYSLIEFGMWNGKTFVPYRKKSNGQIHENIEAVERDNVKPEHGLVVETPGQVSGVDFTSDEWKRSLIFVGGKSNGWLYDAAKPYLIKNNTVANWSEFAELFGMDVRVFKTGASGDDLKKAESSLKKAVGGGSMIMDPEDSLEYIGTGRSDAFQVFKQLVDTQDSAISKLILGQDVIANNTGQVIGEVGERVSDLYGDSDAKFLKFIIEDKLFPLLALNGIPTENHTFEWGTKENVSLIQRAEIDLNIAKMGFRHSDEYINETYDTNVETSESADLTKTANRLKEVYNGISKADTAVR